jgi:hypothetical protein
VAAGGSGLEPYPADTAQQAVPALPRKSELSADQTKEESTEGQLPALFRIPAAWFGCGGYAGRLTEFIEEELRAAGIIG